MMGIQCEIKELQEISDIIDSHHQTPKYSDNGFPMVRVTDIKGGFLDFSNCLKVSEEIFKEYTKKYTPKKGDIVISRVGSYGITSYVNTDQPFCLGQNTAIIVPKINNRYLFYCFQSAYVQNQIENSVVGSTQKTLSLILIKELKIQTYNSQIQNTIAHILGSLDDKIELNCQMNATLEAMARAIFKSWFVDFDPVRAKAGGRQPAGMDAETAALFPDGFEEVDGREVPRGWGVKPLDEIAIFLNGLALQKYPAESEDNFLPVIKIAQLHKGNTEGSDKASVNIPPEYIVNDGDVLFSWSGSLEVILWCGGIGALNQHLFKVSSKSYPKWFYYCWIKYHLPDFQLIAEGKATTMGHIQRHHLSEAMVIVPPPEPMKKVDKMMTNLLNKVIANAIESRTLAQIRDILLPKLMSGEIQVG